MALDLSTFRELYPEMERVPDATVQAKLDEAEGRLDPDYWDTVFDQAHGLKAAHLIAISPAGRQARLNPDKADGNTSIYEREFDRMVQERYTGPVVL